MGGIELGSTNHGVFELIKKERFDTRNWPIRILRNLDFIRYQCSRHTTLAPNEIQVGRTDQFCPLHSTCFRPYLISPIVYIYNININPCTDITDGHVALQTWQFTWKYYHQHITNGHVTLRKLPEELLSFNFCFTIISILNKLIMIWNSLP